MAVHSQRLGGHHPLSEPVQTAAVGEDHQLAQVGAGDLLLPVLRGAVNTCILSARLLENTQTDASEQLVMQSG